MTEAELKPPGTKFLRTDVRYMSRADLFVSSRQFLLVGVLGLVLTATAGLLAVAEPRQEAPNFYALVAMFLVFILSGMGLAGACTYSSVPVSAGRLTIRERSGWQISWG